MDDTVAVKKDKDQTTEHTGKESCFCDKCFANKMFDLERGPGVRRVWNPRTGLLE